MKKSISQRDIAKAIGVNVSTVSRALNGHAGVSPDIRDTIVAYAEKFGYRPNPFAMSLRYDTTHMIGIVVPDMSFNHYAHIIKWIEAEARDKGYMCIITDSGDKYKGEVECIDHLLNLHVEGIAICLSEETTDFSHLKRLRDMHLPTVLFDRVADAGCPTVTINDVDSARLSVLHLIDGGSRRIAFLGGPNQMKQTVDRKHGYLEALRERGLTIEKELVKCNYISFNSGLSDTLELLSQESPPNAILATHGLLSIAAFQAIMSKGLRIPDDVAIIGFMSDWVASMTFPCMTYIKQNLKEIGCTTFRVLFDQINGEKNLKNIIVNARLDIRGSTRKLP